jgi:hypothetical protein
LSGQFNQIERTKLLIERLCQNMMPFKDTLPLEKMIDRCLERGFFLTRWNRHALVHPLPRLGMDFLQLAPFLGA